MDANHYKIERGISFTFRAFRYRNYRLFFCGQGISLVGTWMQQIAVSWLVYRLTNSVFLLGVVGFALQIPILLLALFTGVLADRWNRHHIMVITQILSMLQAFGLAFLVLTGAIQVWHIIFLSIFLGVVNAFDIPTRQAFIVEMVDKKEDLGNAIALNSSMFNGSRLLGPSIAGILIAVAGEGICFLLNGLSFIAVIISLLSMKLTPRKPISKSTYILQEVKEGFSYSLGFAPIRSIILLLGVISLMGMSYTVLMPVFAKQILHGGPHTLGFLMGASGIGALIGALYLASRKSVLGLETVISVMVGIFGLGLVAFSFSKVLWVSLILMLMIGLGMMVQMTSSNTIIQTIVDDDKRGRVMSFYIMAFMGITPFGSLLGGGLASKIGAPNTVLIGGICCVLGAIIFASKLSSFRKLVYPIIYEKMGMPTIETTPPEVG